MIGLGMGLGIPRRRGPRFEPSSIAGLALWFRADSLTLNHNDPVAAWLDSSGNGRNASQGTAGNRPLFQTNVANGRPGVLFDATDDGMSITEFAVVRPYSIFVVEKPTTNGASRRTLNNQAGANTLISAGRDNLNTCFINGNVSDAFVAAGTVAVLNLQVSASATTLYFINGVNQAQVTPASADCSLASLGWNATSPEPAGTTLFEVLVYTSDLTATQRSLVQNYLNTRWR